MELLEKYGISLSSPILEIGCGEGRDAKALLEKGYCLKATDVSPEAISYCKAAFPEHISNFQTLDCLKDHHPSHILLSIPLQSFICSYRVRIGLIFISYLSALNREWSLSDLHYG